MPDKSGVIVSGVREVKDCEDSMICFLKISEGLSRVKIDLGAILCKYGLLSEGIKSEIKQAIPDKTDAEKFAILFLQYEELRRQQSQLIQHINVLSTRTVSP